MTTKVALLASTAPQRIHHGPSQTPNPNTALEKLARPAARPRARQRRRPAQGARWHIGGDEDSDEGDDDEDVDGGDGEPDSLVPDPQVCKEFGVSAMTLWRWDRDPDLNFPTRVSIRGRNFRSRRQIEKFKAHLLRGAIARRSREARG
jgi:predicted DNA-binding transcriptional regulator AlpA